MRYDRSNPPQKGSFLTGGIYPGSSKPVRQPLDGITRESEFKTLKKKFPYCADMVQAAGKSPEEQRRLAFEAANREIEQKLAAIKEKVAAFKKATGR